MTLKQIIEEGEKEFDEKFGNFEFKHEKLGHTWNQEMLKDFLSSQNKKLLEAVIEMIEEERPQGDATYHQTYNDGKRDLSDNLVAKLKEEI